MPVRRPLEISNNDGVHRVIEIPDLRDRLRQHFDARQLASADLLAKVGRRAEVCSHRSTMSVGLN
jgi:hypothetical protein